MLLSIAFSPHSYAKIFYYRTLLYIIGEMASLEAYLDQQLALGRSSFSSEEARGQLVSSQSAFASAAHRLVKKHKLANLRHEFYLILRPEDQVIGAPDPARWIGPLMEHEQIDYRISLLRAAAFHGSSHQAAMVFQVVAPHQLRPLQIGRHRLQFIYQAPGIFEQVNKPEWLDQIRTPDGYARVAGVEMTLLDCIRYFHKVGGIASVAQIVKDIAAKADGRKLAELAVFYENSAVRRLGYLLDITGHERISRPLQKFARQAKSSKPLDPSVKPIAGVSAPFELNSIWKLTVAEPIEVDS